jgi:hypothetical protein
MSIPDTVESANPIMSNQSSYFINDVNLFTDMMKQSEQPISSLFRKYDEFIKSYKERYKASILGNGELMSPIQYKYHTGYIYEKETKSGILICKSISSSAMRNVKKIIAQYEVCDMSHLNAYLTLWIGKYKLQSIPITNSKDSFRIPKLSKLKYYANEKRIRSRTNAKRVFNMNNTYMADILNPQV